MGGLASLTQRLHIGSRSGKNVSSFTKKANWGTWFITIPIKKIKPTQNTHSGELYIILCHITRCIEFALGTQSSSGPCEYLISPATSSLVSVLRRALTVVSRSIGIRFKTYSQMSLKFIFFFLKKSPSVCSEEHGFLGVPMRESKQEQIGLRSICLWKVNPSHCSKTHRAFSMLSITNLPGGTGRI